jgi:hypothetical protein
MPNSLRQCEGFFAKRNRNGFLFRYVRRCLIHEVHHIKKQPARSQEKAEAKYAQEAREVSGLLTGQTQQDRRLRLSAIRGAS